MVHHDGPVIRHERLLGLGLLAGFLTLVAGAVGVYIVGSATLHHRISAILPPVVRLFRMPALAPANLVLGAAVALMVVALIALFVHDARHEPAVDDAPGEQHPT